MYRLPYFFLYFLLLFIFPFLLYADNDAAIDSLNKKLQATANDSDKVNLLLTLSREYQSAADYDAAREAAEQASALAEALDLPGRKSVGMMLAGFAAHKQGKYDEALAYYQSALQIRQSLGDNAARPPGRGAPRR